MADNRNTGGQGTQANAPGAGSAQRTGPGSGNQRGNDLPSEGATQKDGRRTEGAIATPSKRGMPGQTGAEGDGNDRGDSGPGREAEGKTSEPTGTDTRGSDDSM